MYIVYDGNDVITITPETSYASVRSICTTKARANLSIHATETPENRFLVTPLEKFSLAVGALIYRTEASRISEENANPMLEYLPHHTIRLLSL